MKWEWIPQMTKIETKIEIGENLLKIESGPEKTSFFHQFSFKIDYTKEVY